MEGDVERPAERGRATSALLPALTYTRIALVPVVMALILVGPDTDYGYPLAAVVFAFAAGTDFLDGYLARRWAVSTALGSFLDTTADKLLVSAALIALVDVDRASAWIAAVVIGRELLILGLRGVVAAEGVVFPPSVWGKLKTNVQFAAILLAIVRFDEPLGPLLVDEWAMLAAGVITVLSGVEYLGRFASVLSSEPPRSPGR
jgi:CDP-diacylglycerol--glycerol-3-phosphate 3-phosphatidyltransferase